VTIFSARFKRRKNMCLIPMITQIDATHFDEIYFDWAVTSDMRLKAIKRSVPETACYMDLSGEDVIARRSMRVLIYVLTHDLQTTEDALRRYANSRWARVCWIPTTYLLESVMYHRTLAERQREWEHADFVGTVSHRAHEKIPDILERMDEIFGAATETRRNFVALFHKPDDLLVAAEANHPGFTRVWDALGTLVPGLATQDRLFSFYGNYWACTPTVMRAYMQYFKIIKDALETIDDAWKDSGYLTETNQHLHQSRENCMRSFGVPYYPFHPFIAERVPCAWAVSEKLDVMYVES
jgi:hypothetical protein